MIKILFFSIVIVQFAVVTYAQKDVLDRIKEIKVMSSTKQDVEKHFGKGEETENELSYYYENETVEFSYFDGRCLEGWSAALDTVISIYISFKERRKLSDLARILRSQGTNLNKLKVKKGLDVVGERYFYDDARGVRYGVDISQKTWFSITYYPSSKHHKARCED